MEKEIILPCGCHKIDKEGFVWSKWIQFSQKGVYGIQSKIGNEWKKLKTVKNPKSGYMQVNIHGRLIRVNRLIAFNFLQNPLCYPEVHHINGKRDDNRVENLRWGNQKQNAEDRKIHGNNAEGIKLKTAKLNEEKVRAIREERSFMSLNQLKNKYGVSRKLILLVCQRKIWKHVL